LDKRQVTIKINIKVIPEFQHISARIVVHITRQKFILRLLNYTTVIVINVT